MLKVDLTTHNGNSIGDLSVANIKIDKKGNILLVKTKKPKLIKGELVGIGTAQFSSELTIKNK
jgi:hypothetical protein